jgi:hypothetical protein
MDPDPGVPKTYGSYGSATLPKPYQYFHVSGSSSVGTGTFLKLRETWDIFYSLGGPVERNTHEFEPAGKHFVLEKPFKRAARVRIPDTE